MKNIVLINSKIFVSENPFSTAKIRSMYSAEERFSQTKETIRTVKECIPYPFIVFVDNSNLPTDMKDYLVKEVDLFINPSDDVLLNEDTDLSPAKGLGELAQIMRGIEYIDGLDFEWNNLFKICGRYTLNSSFNYSKFDNTRNIFKINQSVTDSTARKANKSTQLLRILLSGINLLRTIRKYRASQLLDKFKSGVNRLLAVRKSKTNQLPPLTYKSSTCYFTSFYKISRQNYDQYKESVISSYNLYKHDSRYSKYALELVLCNKIGDKAILDMIGVTIDSATYTWIENI